MGNSEVIKGPQLATIIVDLSTIEVPDRSIFGMIGIQQEGGLHVRDFQIAGTDNFLRCGVAITVRPRRKIP